MQIERLIQQLLKLMEKYTQFGVENVPYYAEKLIVEVWFRVLNSLYSPQQFLHNLALVGAIQALVVSIQFANNIADKMIMQFTTKGKLERVLLGKLASATSYCEWRDIATQLDELKGLNVWRNIDASSLYDSSIIAKRISGTVDMLNNGDAFNLMFRLRGGLARDQFGVQHSGLFTRAMAGTKHIVERYHEAVASALCFICDTKDEEVPTDAKLAFFNETRHSYGRTALLLSGGGYLGYYHMGVVKALWTQVMLPRVISGSSAGSIMTAIVGTRTDEQLCALVMEPSVPKEMRMDFLNHSTELRHPRAQYLQSYVPKRFHWYSSVVLCWIFEDKLYNLDTVRFISALKQDIGHETFQEAFDRTGRIINITVAPLNSYDPPRLLNYITAPHVCVWSAAAASSAIPGMFDPVALIVKEPDGQFRPENEWTRQGLVGVDATKAAKMASYSDGSVESDLPMQQLSELFNVNHFIVSQVNPHSAILSSMAWRASVWSNPFYRTVVGYARFLKDQCRDWLKNIVGLFIFRSNAPAWSAKRGLAQTLTQEYEGREMDVTIMPWAGHISAFTALTSAIKNPTVPEYLEVLDAAQANTWPSISRIRAHCLVEMTLDKCVQRLRKRISEDSEAAHAAASASQSDFPSKQHHVKGKMDRTPSFYTSRSIVNLSGLSVADPSPVHSSAAPQRRPSADAGTLNCTHSRDVLPLRLRSSSLSRAWSIGQSMDEGDLAHSAAAAMRAVEEEERSGVQTAGDAHGDDDTEDGFWNFAVKGAEVPLASDVPSRVQSVDIARTISTENLLKEDHTMHKTTHMANFYYKRSLSTDNFKDFNN